MSHASMAGYFLFFYNRYRKEEILKRKEEKLMSLLEVKNVKKIYTTRFGSNQVEALRDVNFTVERGEYVAIMGESGSGKTTLLNILAALDKPTEGKVYLKDRDLGKLKEKEIATFRRQNLGFVFQDFNLLDTFSLKDNIFLPLVLSGKKYPEMEKRLKPIVEKLGIGKFFDAIVDGNQISHSKPDPEVFLLAAEKLHQKPSDCLVVEDAEAGVKAALNGGFLVAGIGPAKDCSNVNYPLLSLSELLAIEGHPA